MKRSFFSLILSFIATISFAQEVSTAQWEKNNITVDGNAADWNHSLKHYDNDTRLFFDFKNDSNDLYLCFQTKDEITEEKIMRSGMKIILSNKINGKHKAVINFPLGIKHSSTPVQQDEETPQEGVTGYPRTHKAFGANDSMEVKGFADKNGLIPANDISGIHAAMGRDSSNALTIEIAIPFKEMFGNDYQVKDLSKEISLNVIINAMPAGSQNHESGYAHGGGRGGGRMGGGYGHGGMHGSRGTGEQNEADDATQQTGLDRMAMFQKSELKEKFQLATPQ
jgi:hypothetical protein